MYSRRGGAGSQPLHLLGRRRGRYLGLRCIQVAAVGSGGLACGFVQGREGDSSEISTLASCTGKLYSSSLRQESLSASMAHPQCHGAPGMPWRPSSLRRSPCSVRPSAPGLLGTHLPLITAPAGSALLRCWEPTCRAWQQRAELGIALQPLTTASAPGATCCTTRHTPCQPSKLPRCNPALLNHLGSRTLGLPPFFSVSMILMVSSGVRSCKQWREGGGREPVGSGAGAGAD